MNQTNADYQKANKYSDLGLHKTIELAVAHVSGEASLSESDFIELFQAIYISLYGGPDDSELGRVALGKLEAARLESID